MSEEQRTAQQNKALHLAMKRLSIYLNDCGLDMKTVLKPHIDIPWDEEGKMAKKHLWKPLQEIMLDKESTADCNTTDYNKVYEVLTRHLATSLEVAIPPWPDARRGE